MDNKFVLCIIKNMPKVKIKTPLKKQAKATNSDKIIVHDEIEVDPIKAVGEVEEEDGEDAPAAKHAEELDEEVLEVLKIKKKKSNSSLSDVDYVPELDSDRDLDF